MDCLQAGSADLVDGVSRFVFGNATIEFDLARNILAVACLNGIAKNDVVNLIRSNGGAF